MTSTKSKTIRFSAALAAVAFPLGLAACGSSDDSSSDSSKDSSSSEESAAPSEDTSEAAAAGENFGEGCAAVPKDGKGSFNGMAKDKVATAASNNPALKTLVTAVTEANLAATLNEQKAITVFAPTNDAFKAMDKATLDKAMGDPKGLLTTVLTHHVVEGKLAPEDLAGEHKTLAGDTITVEGEGEDFTVGDASVVCGNVKTDNATVYIIDGVLLPTAK